MKMKNVINLPPEPTHVKVEFKAGRIIGRDLVTGEVIREGKWVPILNR